MKRILFVHHISSIGGGSYCLLSILRGIDRSLFEPLVLLKKYGPLADEVERMGIKVEYMASMVVVPYNETLMSLVTLATYIRVSFVQKEFLHIIKKLYIDIVYLNNMMLYPYLKTAAQAGCKTIMHIREHWPMNEHKMQMRRAQSYARKYANYLIAINNYCALMFHECKDKISIIYDWFDVKNRYENRPFNEIFDEPMDSLKVLLFTGGIGQIKGTYEVVKTFTEHIKGDEYRLLMMGNGMDYKIKFDGLKGIIKKLLMLFGWKPYGYKVIKAIEKDKRVMVIPSTYNMVDIYRQAYCTVSYFTMPHANLALAEAVYLGTVAIAARTEEAIEYSGDGKGAVLFNIRDREDFVKKLFYVFEQYNIVKKEAEKYSIIVRELFDSNTNIIKLNNVLRKVSEENSDL